MFKMKKVLSLALVMGIMASMSTTAFATEVVEVEDVQPVIISAEDADDYVMARSSTKYSGTVSLSTTSSTPICSFNTGFNTVVTCFNDGPGAVEFTVGSQRGSVDSGNGIQFTVGMLQSIDVYAKANWSDGDYAIIVLLE